MNALLARSARETAYLTAGLLTSIVALTVWITAVTLSLTLALFIVGLPRDARERSRVPLDRRPRPPQRLVPAGALRSAAATRTTAPTRCFGRLKATFSDPQTWRDFGWLSIHSLVGFAFGVIAVSLVVSVARPRHAAALVLGAARRRAVRAVDRRHAPAGDRVRVPGHPAGGVHRRRAARAWPGPRRSSPRACSARSADGSRDSVDDRAHRRDRQAAVADDQRGLPGRGVSR